MLEDYGVVSALLNPLHRSLYYALKAKPGDRKQLLAKIFVAHWIMLSGKEIPDGLLWGEGQNEKLARGQDA